MILDTKINKSPHSSSLFDSQNNLQAVGFIDFFSEKNHCLFTVHFFAIEIRLFNMPNKLDIQFSSFKQARSQQTLDDLKSGAFAIVESGDPGKFTARALSKISGYALGTLHKRLASIEKVFIWAIHHGREKHLEKLARILRNHNENASIHDLVERLVDESFATVAQVNPKVMRFFENRVTRENGLPSNYFDYLDSLAGPLKEATQRDKTGTFRVMTENELKLTLRSMLMIGERPFVEGNEIAGTAEHRAITIESLVRLLSSKSP